MTISATPFTARFGETSGSAVRLEVGPSKAEVFPFVGFNCLRWEVDGEPILFAEPPGTLNPSPTRSGHPILFPFPNRMRDGRFVFEGRTYQLPLNDSTKVHAIHGFTPRNPWRVVGTGTETGSAYVTGEFHLSRDLPAAQPYWPADFIFRLTYRLSTDALRVEAEVTNPDHTPLPFGLGYHPYFRPPGASPGSDISQFVLHAGSAHLWELVESLPTGKIIDSPADLGFDPPRLLGPTHLDHVYTDLFNLRPNNGLRTLATLSAPGSSRWLAIRADDTFRELVLFTPPHRRAIAIEPYSCTTDAANLTARGIPAGWRVLPPVGRFQAVVEYRLGGES